MRPIVVAILWLAFTTYGIAQSDTVSISLVATYKGKPIKLNHYYALGDDSVQVEQLKFYIGNIQLLKDTSLVESSSAYRIVDASKPESTQFAIARNSHSYFNQITFGVGIDSVTNAGGVKGDALDPMHGMYWAWQSGYINLKLEGSFPKCQTRLHKFQYHLGGFLGSGNAYRVVRLDVLNQTRIMVEFDMSDMLNALWETGLCEVMSPGKEAMRLSDVLVQSFKLAHEK